MCPSRYWLMEESGELPPGLGSEDAASGASDSRRVVQCNDLQILLLVNCVVGGPLLVFNSDTLMKKAVGGFLLAVGVGLTAYLVYNSACSVTCGLCSKVPSSTERGTEIGDEGFQGPLRQQLSPEEEAVLNRVMAASPGAFVSVV